MQIKFKPQDEFPLVEEYRRVFPITKNTIFAYKDTIYANKPLPQDIIHHEYIHLLQQEHVGVEIWVYNFLNDPTFRLHQEVEAFKAQVDFIKDRNLKSKVRLECASVLSSGLYGNMISRETAMHLLK